QAKRALFLGNRRARKVATQLDQAIAWLQEAGLELVQKPMRRPQDVQQLIRDHRDAVDLVIIGGGDGTLNTAIEALLETQLPLGVLPLGTANDLAHTLDIPSD